MSQHTPQPTSQRENPYAGQGAVLLDIGGAVGALVVTTPAGAEGREVELRRSCHGSHDHEHHEHDDGHEHKHEHHPHVAVVARPGPRGPVHSLVYPGVIEGSYDLVPIPGDRVALSVHVVGGAVTHAAMTLP